MVSSSLHPAPLLALCLLLSGSVPTSVSAKVSCPDTTESPASSASSVTSSASASASSDASGGSALIPKAYINDQNDFKGRQITVWPTVQQCLTFNCVGGISITWDDFEQVNSNGTLLMSAFTQEFCQGDALGPWSIADNEFPTSLDTSVWSILVWEGEPTWTERDFGCYQK